MPRRNQPKVPALDLEAAKAQGDSNEYTYTYTDDGGAESDVDKDVRDVVFAPDDVARGTKNKGKGKGKDKGGPGDDRQANGRNPRAPARRTKPPPDPSAEPEYEYYDDDDDAVPQRDVDTRPNRDNRGRSSYDDTHATLGDSSLAPGLENTLEDVSEYEYVNRMVSTSDGGSDPAYGSFGEPALSPRAVLAERRRREMDAALVEQERVALGSAGSLNELDPRDRQIVTLTRRLRSTRADLERERVRSAKHMRTLELTRRELETLRQAMPLRQLKNLEATQKREAEVAVYGKAPPGDGHEDDPASTARAMNKLKERLSRAQHRNHEYRIEIEKLKAELRISQSTLKREIGSDADTERAVDPDSGWRGRAERITLLRAKVKNLEGALRTGRGGGGGGEASFRGGTGMVGGLDTFGEEAHLKNLRALEASKTETIQRLQAEMEELTAEMDDMRLKYKGSSSRVKSLEDTTKTLRAKIQILLDKTANDDRLIAALKKEIADATTRAATTAHPPSNPRLDGDEALVAQIDRQEEIISSLHDELETVLDNAAAAVAAARAEGGGGGNGNANGNVNGGGGAQASALADQLRLVDVVEMRESLALLARENEGLKRVVGNLREGLDEALAQELEARTQVSELTNEVNGLRQRQTRGRGGPAASSPPKRSQLEEAEERLAVARDNIDALKVAHQSSLASREEELEMYYKLLAETREAFYEGIQELRAYLEVEG